MRMVTNQMTMRRNGGDRDMKIGLLDVDGCHWLSLPQMKLSAYHKQRGDTVEKWFPMNHYDTLYVSKVFTHSPDEPCVFYADEIVQGGTGYFYPDGGPPLPDAIEHCYPDYTYREYGVWIPHTRVSEKLRLLHREQKRGQVGETGCRPV